MELKIQNSLLVERFTKAYSIIERRSSIPVLSHVLIKADGDHVTIKTTDLDHSFEDSLEADVTTPGSTLVQAQTFYEILRKSESEMIHMRMSGEELLVKSNTAEFKLMTLNPEEFPETPQLDNGKSFQIQSAELKKLLDLTYFSMSGDETRYNLSGVYLHNDGGKICAVATDAHRLALVESSLVAGIESHNINMILSRKTVLEYRKLLDSVDGEVTVYFNDVYVALRTGSSLFQSRLVDATFPEYTHIIPKTNNEVVITVNRKSFIDVINRIAIVSDEKAPLVKFSIQKQKLTISATSQQKGYAEESIQVNYNGEDCNLGFNPKYITDIACNLSANEIDIYFKDSLSAILVRELGNESALFMVMPMLVN